MSNHEYTKKRRAVFLFITLYVLGFVGFLLLQYLSSGHSGFLWTDYLLAAVIPALTLAYPVYQVFVIKKTDG